MWALNTGTCIAVCNDKQGDLVYWAGLQATGTCISHSQHRKNSGEVLGENEGDWTGKVEISKKVIPSSWQSASISQAPLDTMQVCSVMHPEAIPHHDCSVVWSKHSAGHLQIGILPSLKYRADHDSFVKSTLDHMPDDTELNRDKQVGLYKARSSC